MPSSKAIIGMRFVRRDRTRTRHQKNGHPCFLGWPCFVSVHSPRRESALSLLVADGDAFRRRHAREGRGRVGRALLVEDDPQALVRGPTGTSRDKRPMMSFSLIPLTVVDAKAMH